MMGDRSGLSGMGISLLLGMLTAVPVYALLPIAGLLLKKGGRISNVLIFLCSSVSIRIPLLLLRYHHWVSGLRPAGLFSIWQWYS